MEPTASGTDPTQPDPTPPDPTHLDDRLAHWAAVDPDGEALSYLGRTWTWREWDDRVRRLAGALRSWGIGRGDVVGSLDKNHPATVELTFAAASLGAATAIFNWRLAGEEVDYVVNDSGARLLLVGTELMPLVESLSDRLTAVERIVTVTPEGGEDDQYESALAAAAPAPRGRDVTPDDVCLVMYSSGTTGHPKGVMLTQRNVLEHTRHAHDGWSFEPGDKNMVSMPLFHVGGSSYVQFGVHDGVPTVMTREPDGASLAGAIMAGANRTFLVPAVLAQVLQSGPDAIALFGRLKTYCYGASPMPLPLLRAAMDAWPETDFIQVYGLTEVCGVITHLMPDEHREALATGREERLTSAGRLLPEAELRVVDPATLADVPTGEHGELWFRTPQTMKGYLNRPEATAEVITEDGWLRTGDMGKVDADGYVYVEDRLKDMIISGGENIYSPEVERVLAEHPGVAEVAVIGVPDDRWGEVVKAVVTRAPGAEVTEDELVTHAREHLAHFKCPRSVDFVTEMPRNPTGKILKRDLRRQYWEGHDRSVI
ncbi:long-chain-fatty-acid--CoA ligase [Nocardioides terrisoli]|uniref:long-chain-fatty-acid--CoA ligase n=1 Tax=Nocardioides terrisoli TaxID=3388267 RepID=UPI00287BAC8F|nr:long-chain-fatty-acid--CoA ligase [Nocardioides marmorisolisilvae]